MVVPREEDLLQQVFGDTAHNPESNLDVRMPTPSPGHQTPQPHRQPPSPANFSHPSLAVAPVHYPHSYSPSAWSSQSSLTSHVSTMSTGPHPPPMMVVHPPFHQRPHQPNAIPPPHGAHIPITPHHPQTQMRHQANAQQKGVSRKHSLSSAGDGKQQVVATVVRKQSLPVVVDSRRQAVHTIQNTLSGVPHQVPSGSLSSLPTSTNATGTVATSEQTSASVFGVYEPILDRAVGRPSFKDNRRLERDPDGRIYEVVQTRVVESKFNANDNERKDMQGGHVGRKKSTGDGDVKRVRVQSLSPPRLRGDQAHTRSASVHTRAGGLNNNDVNEGNTQGSAKKGGRSTKHNLYSRRSNTEPLPLLDKENIMVEDKSTQNVIDRIKKDTVRKEEFLRRPNQPIWLPASKTPMIHSDYHVNPQKFQQPLWPPPGAQTPPSPGSITKALTCIVTPRHEHVQLRRVKSEIEQRETATEVGPLTRGSSVPNESTQNESSEGIDGTMEEDSAKLNQTVAQGASGALPRSLVVNAVPKPYVGSTSEANPASARYGKSFTSTLSRIQENIPIPEYGSSSSLASHGQSSSRLGDSSQTVTPGGTPTGSQTSLNSAGIRSLPLAWVGDNERIRQLQIVSRRAKQFESSHLEKEASAKSAFHRFELSRLSQKSKAPNVAQRKQEFETKDQASSGFDYEFGTFYNNTPRQRKSAELTRSDSVCHEMAPSPPKVFRSLSDGGNVFPVNRRLYSPTTDEGVRTSTASDDGVTRIIAVNRTIPIGGPNIHCDPPPYYGQLRPQSDPDVLERERSNSVCSQVSMTSILSTQSMDETGSARQKTIARQNSYLSALRSPVHVVPSVPPRTTSTNAGVSSAPTTPLAATSTPTTTTTTTTTSSSSPATTKSSNAAMVARRNKAVYEDEGERLVRRVSYLKATSGDRMYSDSDLDSDTEDRSASRIEGVEVVGVDGGVCSTAGTPVTPAGPLCVADLPSPASLQSAIVRQGTLHVKLTIVDGKKSHDRSWKTTWAVVQGRALIFYKDRQHAVQTPLGVEEQISLRGAEVEVASDYTKRRNVLRLATPGGSQLLLQADTPPEMLAWLSTLHNNCAIPEGESGSKASLNNNNVSPQTSNKAMRKLTSSLRTRSPTGQSPSTKTRKPSSVESNSSPKSKTWRGHLVRPFMKKIHGGSPAVTPTTPLPEGATIGVDLEDCPPSEENEFVPLLVALCVSIVETRGIQTQGIYRIPGNKAAVTHLTEMINKGPKAIDFSDPRWTDVNVISSLVKQFFQKLPDPLFTCDLYPLFIEASKIEDPNQRLVELKKMVQELPDCHYETLRYLILHLHHIVMNSEFNKMDVRNLAIVFGPTLVRSGDDNMITMVTDMSHQCKIIETLISQALWFFNDDDSDDLSPPSLNSLGLQGSASDSLSPTVETETPSSQALLLHNIQKVEGGNKGDLKKDIVSSIISAANRKVHKVKYKKPIEDKPIDDVKYSDKEGGFEERDIDKEAELRKQRLLNKQMESMIELPDPKPMSERKISNMSLVSVHGHPSNVSNLTPSPTLDRTSNSDSAKHSISEQDGRLFCVVKKDSMSSSAPLSGSSVSVLAPASHQSSHMTPESASLFGDEVAIRSYAGLSASTQERIRRFEMETRAMLHRDLTKHRRETERRDVERRRLEELWQRAKQDMESEDILDQLADNPTEVVRKISDYSWRLQGMSESMGGDQGSLTSQSSSSSSQTGLISAALTHHPLSNTLTPSTNATTTQVSNHSQPQLPIIQVESELEKGLACDSTDTVRHGMLPQQPLSWLDYNTASPHSTLGSTSSSGSSGYGSLTRSSMASKQSDIDDTTVKTDSNFQSDHPGIGTKPPSTVPQSSPSVSKKKKSSKGSGFLFGLKTSSSSPSLFPSVADAGTELTPTRKIGQTVIYPESPRPPPHNRHPSQTQSGQSSSSPSLTSKPSTPVLGRQKDSLLHHILPSRLYHSPRPLRRGSSAENVSQPLVGPVIPPAFDTQKVANNGTLKRAKASRDQILNGPELGIPRCGSLDSLRDGSLIPPDDGSDLLSAITATFEEKMRNLQESSLCEETATTTTTTTTTATTTSPSSSPSDTNKSNENTTRGKSECRLYRDPSLHRRRTSPRNSSANNSTNTAVPTQTVPQVEDVSQSTNSSERSTKLSEEVSREIKVKRSDSLTKSEKTENNLKEKTEKRARELKRTDTQESLNEKKPKEMKRSDGQDGLGRSRDLPRKSESRDNSSGSTRRPSDIRSRRHNVKELKEKFEQNTDNQPSGSQIKSSNSSNNNSNKPSKSSMRRTGYRGPIKRRHTVGGTKDLAKWAWLHSGEGSRSNPRSTRLSAWERLQPLVADERLNTDRSLEAWLARERIRTSSPDLSRPQQLVLPCDTDDKENIHRRLSVQEAVLNPLYPVLESHV